MSKFVIGVRGKVPYLIEGPGFIVTDNDDYTLELSLDSEWDGFAAKTVVYIYDNGKYILHPIEGNTDTIPVLEHSGRLHIGVTAGEIRTTTWLSIPIKSSVRRKGHMQIPEPEPAVYDQIMEIANEAVANGVNGFWTEGRVSPTSGTTYTFVISTPSGKKYKADVPAPPNALRHGEGKPTSSVSGAGSYNAPFWLDTTTGILYNYVGQNKMIPMNSDWEPVKSRPQVTSGEGAPTTGTVGEKDDLYVDSKTKYLYWCSGWEYSETQPGRKIYNWVRLSVGSTGGGSTVIPGPGTSDSPGTQPLKATLDADTGELTVAGGKITFDEETGELTINGSPLSVNEDTGELTIGG